MTTRILLLRCVAVLAVVPMAGCVRYQAKPIDPVQVAADLDARNLNDTGLKAFMEKSLDQELASWPLQTWKADLLALVAMYYHPEMDLARARWGIVNAATETAAELPNPTVSVTPGYNITTLKPSPWIVSASVDFPIETANKRGYRIATANHNAEAARASVLDAAWQVRNRMMSAILDYEGGLQATDLLMQELACREQVVQLMELQLPQGNIPAMEVTEANIALRNTRLALLEAQRQRAEARVRVADSLGLPVSALEDIHMDVPLTEELPETVSSDEARRRALTTRADVLALLAEYEASQSALQLEVAKQYPDIHLGPGYEYDQGDKKWSLGISMTLPIFNQNRGAIREAEARRTETAMKFTALQEKIITEVDGAVVGYGAAQSKLMTARELLTDVQKRRDAAEASYKAGDISNLELTLAHLELQTHRQSIQEATLEAHRARLAVEAALQESLNMPERAVLSWPRDSSPSK